MSLRSNAEDGAERRLQLDNEARDKAAGGLKNRKE